MLKVCVPKEVAPGETRVAATPETVKRMIKEGLEVAVECGRRRGGVHLGDRTFAEAGARIAATRRRFGQADLVLKVAPFGPNPRWAATRRRR